MCTPSFQTIVNFRCKTNTSIFAMHVRHFLCNTFFLCVFHAIPTELNFYLHMRSEPSLEFFPWFLNFFEFLPWHSRSRGRDVLRYYHQLKVISSVSSMNFRGKTKCTGDMMVDVHKYDLLARTKSSIPKSRTKSSIPKPPVKDSFFW